MEKSHTPRTYLDKHSQRWIKYLSQYFGKDLLLPDLQKLDEYRLKVSHSFSQDSLRDVQVNRTPALFILRSAAIPSSPTDFLKNYVGVSLDQRVGFFDHLTPSKSLLDILAQNTPIILKTQGGFPRRPLILNNNPQSIVEDLAIQPKGFCQPILQTVNKYNQLWQTSIGHVHCGISGVLSEPGARSISHYHHVPFWNYSYRGTKLYVLYDIKAATKFVTVRSDSSTSSKPLKWKHFLILAQQKKAWLAEIQANQVLFVPEAMAHDVFTVDDGMLYTGMQGNWLSDSANNTREILQKATYPSHGAMQFPATTRDGERMLDKDKVYSDSSDDDDTPEYYKDEDSEHKVGDRQEATSAMSNISPLLYRRTLVINPNLLDVQPNY
jgi:hypothetical protein